MTPAPKQIGPYPVRGEIGRGGMGVVYAARDDRLHRDVAIKALDPAMADDPRRIDQFRSEARAIAQLNHPNIVQIYQMLELDDRIYLVLEYVPGTSLAQLIDEDAPLGVTRTLEIGADIARALDAAHARAITHRDLKPSNVRIRTDGLAKILDFGLAQAVHAPLQSPRSERRDSSTRSVAFRGGGTPGYMAPEQIRAEPPDARADIFSFGCVLYECLTGARAFDGRDAAAIIHATLHEQPDFARLPETLPDPLPAILRACLAKSPADRPHSILEIARHIDAALGRRHETPTPSTPLPGVLRGMPRPRTSFVGRRNLLRRLAADVETTRLVTLIGPGGSGKTRLAVELAPRLLTRFADGVCWIELASIREPEFLPGLVASTLGVDDRPDTTAADAIAHALADRAVLLIFDNCEHVLDAAAPLIDRLLRDAPALHVLATTRQSLRLQGEHLVPIHGLSLPETDADALAPRAEAVELFAQRARMIDPEFDLTPDTAPAVARICRRLDGIPLAIEFAAARTRIMSPEQIEACLEDRFRLLVDHTHAAPERFRTLRAAVDWSYDMLCESERRMLRCLSVFAGGWFLDAACAVCAPDGCVECDLDLDEFGVLDLLTNLVDKSLVRVERPRAAPPRYALLETIREYAAEKLRESGEEPGAVARHLDHYVARAAEAARHFNEADQALWLERIEADHENILAALARHEDSPRYVACACRLAAAMLRFWQLHGHFRTGLEACTRLLASPALPRGTIEHADVLNTAATMATKLGDLHQTDRYAEEALSIAREHDDDATAAKALNTLGNSAYFQRRLDDAERLHTEGLRINRKTESLHGIGASLNNLANIAHDRGRLRVARPLYEEALAINRKAGNRASQAINLYNLAIIAYHDHDYERARRLCDEALHLRREIGDRFGIAETLAQLARVATREHHADDARRASREGLRIRADLGDRLGLCDSLEGIAMLAAETHEHDRAARLLGAAARIREEIGADHAQWERDDLDDALTPAREALGLPAFESQRALGHARTTDAVLQDTLEWLAGGQTPAPNSVDASRPTL